MPLHELFETMKAGVKRRRLTLAGAAVACALGSAVALCGCGVETAAIAAAGVTAGFGIAQGQAESFINGELKAARLVTLDETWVATIAAFNEAKVPIKIARREKYDCYIMGRAPGGPEIKVQMKAKSPMITKVEIRVGMMGDQAVSRLALARIDHQLGIPQPIVPVEQSPIVAPLPQPAIQPDQEARNGGQETPK